MGKLAAEGGEAFKVKPSWSVVITDIIRNIKEKD
jgi:hypothetical protein